MMQGTHPWLAPTMHGQQRVMHAMIACPQAQMHLAPGVTVMDSTLCVV
jgi:hypothetical protein